ncbi:MAG: sugar ABC transporter substrate-binding protein, partial [Spirochaetales bacterium]|nr:sugar ABC transporter substrate-binding protein [Spirochaetales bacterium]
MKKIGIGMSCLLLLLAVLLTSCQEREEKTPEKDGPVLIGFSAATETFLLERWDRDIQIFLSSARDRGAEVIMQKAEGDAQGQIPQIEYLIEQNVD